MAILLPLACLAAYLPVSGPPPLRFQALAVTPEIIRALAGLPPEPSPVPDFPIGSNSLPSAAAAVVLTAKSPAPFETNGTAVAPGFTSTGYDELITPQMMVPFFQRKPGDTNTPAPAAYVPITFIPPVPVTRPSSKSTYSSP